jgi:lysophospholipase L1-like esterase
MLSRFLAVLLVSAVAFTAGVLLYPFTQLNKPQPTAAADLQHAPEPEVEAEPEPEPEDHAKLVAAFSNKKRLVLLGDSRLGDAGWGTLLDDYEIATCGPPCDNAARVVSWLAETVPAPGGVYVLQMGIDDLKNGATPAAVVANSRAIVHHLVWSRRARVILLPILFAGGENQKLNARISETNEGLRDVGTNAGVMWLDVNQLLCPGGTLAQQYSTDGLHLNPQGYRRWTEAVRPLVRAALNEWR